jgi:cytochrome P450
MVSLFNFVMIFSSLAAWTLSSSSAYSHDRVIIKKLEDQSSAISSPWTYWESLSNALSISKLSSAYGSNAAHRFIDEGYLKLANENQALVARGLSPKLNIFQFPVFLPGRSQLYTHIVAIGNPVVLEALREIPRYEITDQEVPPKNPDLPRIAAGYSFQVLDAIGMDILSAAHLKHRDFIHSMVELLAFKNFETSIVDSSKELLDQIDFAQKKGQKLSLDFRIYALKIFLGGFFPGHQFDQRWMSELSEAIETVSNMAFASIMNPYSDLETLKISAMEILDPFLNHLIQLEKSSLKDSIKSLLENEVEANREQIYKQVITALLFAGGDNVKKDFDHTLITLGSKAVREKYLNKDTLTKKEITSYIEEVARLYTTIYAQPGKALDGFTIEYRGETITVPAKSELHYTTYQANLDPSEFGDDSHEFHPERYVRYKKEGKRLAHLATFGSGNRICRGKAITLGIVKYMITQLLQRYRWTACVDGNENSHPTELGFNNSVPGKIEYSFQPFSTKISE